MATEPLTSDYQLKRNVATPERLPAAPPGQIHPENVRRAYANHYADLQIFKVKVVIGLAALVWIAHGCPL